MTTTKSRTAARGCPTRSTTGRASALVLAILLTLLGPASVALAEDTPAAAPAADADAAKALWTKHCASCHGADGKAQTKMGQLLKVRDLTDPQVRGGFDRDRITKAIKEGVKKEGSDKLAMKGFSDKLSDAEITALVDYIYALGK